MPANIAVWKRSAGLMKWMFLSYVEPKDTREKIDITRLNAELKTTVAKIDQLRADIDAIVAEIEGDVE